MDNLYEQRNNSSQQSAILKGKGMMIYWSASQLLDYMSDEQFLRVNRKLRNVLRGMKDTIQLESQMEQDAFGNILAGAIESDKNWQKRTERSSRAGKASGASRQRNRLMRNMAETQQGEAETQQGEYANTNGNEQMFNQSSTNVQQIKAKQSKANRGKANQVDDNKMNLAASDTGNSSGFATIQQPANQQQNDQDNPQVRLSALKDQLNYTPEDQPQRRAELQQEITKIETELRQSEQSDSQDDDVPF